MTTKQQEIIKVLKSSTNVRNDEKVRWKTNIMQENIPVLDTIFEIIKKNKAYQKPNSVFVQRLDANNSNNHIMTEPYVLMLELKYETNKGTKEKHGIDLLKVLKLQACRKASNASLTIPTTNTDTV